MSGFKRGDVVQALDTLECAFVRVGDTGVVLGVVEMEGCDDILRVEWANPLRVGPTGSRIWLVHGGNVRRLEGVLHWMDSPGHAVNCRCVAPALQRPSDERVDETAPPPPVRLVYGWRFVPRFPWVKRVVVRSEPLA